MNFKATFMASVMALLVPQMAAAEAGLTDTTVRFGQIAALDGPAAQLGLGMRQGLLAAF